MSPKNQIITAIIVSALMLPVLLPVIGSIAGYERKSKKIQKQPGDVTNRAVIVMVVAAYHELFKEHQTIVRLIQEKEH